MKATREYIEERYYYWRAEIAGAGLWNETSFGKIEIKLRKKSRRCNGMFKRRVRLAGGCKKVTDSIFIYNNQEDFDVVFLDSIIVHEMIHQFIMQSGVTDNRPHGKIFRQMMNAINSAFPGRLKIEISHRVTYNNDSEGEGETEHSLLILHKSKYCYCCVISNNRKDYFNRMLGKLAHGTGITFFCNGVSHDRIFEKYSRCRSRLHGIRMPLGEWESFRAKHGITLLK